MRALLSPDVEVVTAPALVAAAGFAGASCLSGLAAPLDLMPLEVIQPPLACTLPLSRFSFLPNCISLSRIALSAGIRSRGSWPRTASLRAWLAPASRLSQRRPGVRSLERALDARAQGTDESPRAPDARYRSLQGQQSLPGSVRALLRAGPSRHPAVVVGLADRCSCSPSDGSSLLSQGSGFSSPKRASLSAREVTPEPELLNRGRVSSLQVGIVFVFRILIFLHGEFLPFSSSFFVTASFFPFSRAGFQTSNISSTTGPFAGEDSADLSHP